MIVSSESTPDEREKRVEVKGEVSPDRVNEKWIRLNVTDAPLTTKRAVNSLSIFETDFSCVPSEFFGSTMKIKSVVHSL